MANFDLSQYETVEERVKKFYKDHPDGRIITEHITLTTLEAGFKAYVYKNIEDQKTNCAWATGYAYELRDLEKARTQYGKEYETVNYSSWTENAETSAIGRALANAGYMGSKRPTVQEMQKVQRMNNISAGSDVFEIRANKIATGELKENCKKCGAEMTVSKTTGKVYCSKMCWKA